MRLKLENYEQGYRIASLALDECARDKLIEEDLSLIYVCDGQLILLPDDIVLSNNPMDVERIKEFNNYDVLEIWENGVIWRRYDDKSDDNYFFITGACNSNCIMCPSPESTRKHVPMPNMTELMELARHIPSDTPHLTITGGEPFLIGDKFFSFIKYVKEKFLHTEFLFLTNGRVFAIDRFVQLFVETVPDNTIVAIPIHGSCEQVHDLITSAEGSFRQTQKGIKQLLKQGIRVEIRVVISKINVADFQNIAQLIINQFNGVEYVSVIAMEMTGNARVNMNQVWIPYKQTFTAIAEPLRKLVEHGVDVKLYNFPLCTVEKPFWTLCEKSISREKVRFAETCEFCKYKTICGGVFAGTFDLEKMELKAIT